MTVSAIRTRLFVSLASCLLLSSGLVFAQAGTAGLTGTVTDDQGAVLPGVTITISNASNGFVRTTTSAGDGSYQLLAAATGYLFAQGGAAELPHRRLRERAAAGRYASAART